MPDRDALRSEYLRFLLTGTEADLRAALFMNLPASAGPDGLETLQLTLAEVTGDASLNGVQAVSDLHLADFVRGRLGPIQDMAHSLPLVFLPDALNEMLRCAVV